MKKAVVGYYYWIIFYQINLERPQDDRIFRKVPLSVSVKAFRIFSVHISENSKDFNGNRRNLWIVSAVLNPLRYVRNPHYWVRDANVRLV